MPIPLLDKLISGFGGPYADRNLVESDFVEITADVTINSTNLITYNRKILFCTIDGTAATNITLAEDLEFDYFDISVVGTAPLRVATTGATNRINGETDIRFTEYQGGRIQRITQDEFNLIFDNTDVDMVDNYVDSAILNASDELVLGRTGTLPDLTVDLSSLAEDNYVDSATLNASNELVLGRTGTLPDLTVDLSSLSGGGVLTQVIEHTASGTQNYGGEFGQRVHQLATTVTNFDALTGSTFANNSLFAVINLSGSEVEFDISAVAQTFAGDGAGSPQAYGLPASSTTMFYINGTNVFPLASTAIGTGAGGALSLLNNTGGTLTKGTPVVVGVSPTSQLIARIAATSVLGTGVGSFRAQKARIYGFVGADVANGSSFFPVLDGEITGWNFSETAPVVPGTPLGLIINPVVASDRTITLTIANDAFDALSTADAYGYAGYVVQETVPDTTWTIYVNAKNVLKSHADKWIERSLMTETTAMFEEVRFSGGITSIIGSEELYNAYKNKIAVGTYTGSPLVYEFRLWWIGAPNPFAWESRADTFGIRNADPSQTLRVRTQRTNIVFSGSGSTFFDLLPGQTRFFRPAPGTDLVWNVFTAQQNDDGSFNPTRIDNIDWYRDEVDATAVENLVRVHNVEEIELNQQSVKDHILTAGHTNNPVSLVFQKTDINDDLAWFYWWNFMKAADSDFEYTDGITSILWQSETTVRYTMDNPLPAFLEVGKVVVFANCTNASNDGTFQIIARDTNYIEIDNPLRTDATDDEATSPGDMTIEAYIVPPGAVATAPMIYDNTHTSLGIINENINNGYDFEFDAPEGTDGIASIGFISGNTIRYTLDNPVPALVTLNHEVRFEGCTNAVNNGTFAVTFIDAPNNIIHIDNPARTDGTDDEANSPGVLYVPIYADAIVVSHSIHQVNFNCYKDSARTSLITPNTNWFDPDYVGPDTVINISMQYSLDHQSGMVAIENIDTNFYKLRGGPIQDIAFTTDNLATHVDLDPTKSVHYVLATATVYFYIPTRPEHVPLGESRRYTIIAPGTVAAHRTNIRVGSQTNIVQWDIGINTFSLLSGSRVEFDIYHTDQGNYGVRLMTSVSKYQQSLEIYPTATTVSAANTVPLQFDVTNINSLLNQDGNYNLIDTLSTSNRIIAKANTDYRFEAQIDILFNGSEPTGLEFATARLVPRLNTSTQLSEYQDTKTLILTRNGGTDKPRVTLRVNFIYSMDIDDYIDYAVFFDVLPSGVVIGDFEIQSFVFNTTVQLGLK